MDTSVQAHQFFDCLTQKYPPGSEPLESEIRNLKRKLDYEEFSDCDENELVREVENVEQAHSKRLKLKHECDICGKTFHQKYNKTQHMKTHCLSFNCDKCGMSFSRNNYRKKHQKGCKGGVATKTSSKLKCKHCGIFYDTYDLLFQHVITNHPLNNKENHQKLQQGGDASTITGELTREPLTTSENNRPKEGAKKGKQLNRIRKGALNDLVNKIDIIPEIEEKYDLLQFFSSAKSEVEQELNIRRKKVRNVKWYLNVRVDMVRNIEDGTKEKTTPHFRSKTYTSLENDDNEHNLNEAFQKMNGSLEEFIHKGSNWIVNKVLGLEVNTVKYSPISGSSYMELPSKLHHSHAITNIKNEDKKCFLWSVLAALHPAERNPDRVFHYTKYADSLNLTGIDFPVSLSKVEKFEKQNNLSINVFGWEDGQVFPLYMTKMLNGSNEIDLLYLSDDRNSHYCWIKILVVSLDIHIRNHTQNFITVIDASTDLYVKIC
ncbi:unnamed protein product [Mytilus coruscus]|uniref:C2H2-type domain-containing protein n=1 Tax=Mytilus coruscus TaxID=42192 RepID=A0A6J8EU47_MYTCO|nr:unnamed protein product [Mytilus coruscus]